MWPESLFVTCVKRKVGQRKKQYPPIQSHLFHKIGKTAIPAFQKQEESGDYLKVTLSFTESVASSLET